MSSEMATGGNAPPPNGGGALLGEEDKPPPNRDGKIKMSGPQDLAAAGRDRLRAGRADREQVLEALKDAFVQGHLTRDELGARVGQALTARTYPDLAPLTAGIPAGLAAAGPARPPSPARRRPLARAAAGSVSCLVIAFAAVLVGAPLDDPLHPSPYRGCFRCAFPWPLPPYSRQGLFW